MNAPPPAARLVTTLAAFGAVAGVLLVAVFDLTRPRIERNKAQALAAAVNEVLKDPARYETLFVAGDRLAAEPPAGVDPARAEKVYLGFDAAGRALGFAIPGARPGFQDLIRLLFGYEPRARRLLGMTVLESKETPGLGDKIEKDAGFVLQFDGALAPLAAMKAGRGDPQNPSRVDLITGATISSRTVVELINQRILALEPLLAAYWKEHVP